jgi:NAD-dependent DNA ligase
MLSVDTLSDGRLVAHFLMASYLYYHHDRSIMTDADYDKLCARLLAAWKDVKHPHKRLISRKDLAAGTGFYIAEHHYPLSVRSAAWWLHDRVVQQQHV